VNRRSVIEVQTGSRSYPVEIGSGCLTDGAFWQRHIAGRRTLVVTNQKVADHYLPALEHAWPELLPRPETILLPDGESYKTWDSVLAIFEALLLAHADRDWLLIALGGGVIGDLTGFAAATYQRGIDFIQVPTTLLAQVDSSVGGKTGFNLPAAKNMIGAFHQPIAVLADVATLSTLDARELRAGLAEVIKHGAMGDAALFEYLEQHREALLAGDPEALQFVVRASVQIKAGIVAADEREAGLRALLNFGHTFGHAIEAGVGFGEWLHGEAVAAGMVLAATLSVDFGMLDKHVLVRIRNLIEAFGLPVEPPDFTVGQWLTLTASDKKTRHGERRFVLLDQLGQARVVSIEDAQLRDFLNHRAANLES
jgi:3-dehydroquinate synthase